MNLNINYYSVLNVRNDADVSKIKKSYYLLSKKYHPDVNKDEDSKSFFSEISEAWSVLGDEQDKLEYDKKSKFGNNYNEFEEFFMIDMEYNHVTAETTYDKLKNREVLDIVIKIDESFNGELEYPRFVLCKTCKGSGKDMKSKIIIKDEFGNVKKIFDADDGCDYCEGTGKSYTGDICTFCAGYGKVGMKDCDSCKGERRLLGKQKLKGVKLEGDETIVKSMGHLSFYDRGKVGDLIIRFV